MKLSRDQLDQFAAGAESTEMVNGAWRAHRLPRDLGKIYDSVPRFSVRRDCSSGVRLRFITDSARIDLSLRYGESAHPVYQGEIAVDDAAPVAFGPQEHMPIWRGMVLGESTRRPRLIDLWLPHLCKVDVLAVELDSTASCTPAPPLRLRWLAYGDSITQGFCGSLPTRTAIGRCAIEMKADVHNFGVGGSILHSELGSFVPREKFDLITIAYGVCDFQSDVPLESFGTNAQHLLAMLAQAQPGRPILLITPINWNAPDRLNGLGLSIQDYREALCRLAEDWALVRVVAGPTLVPDDTRYFDDWVHPNDAGFECYAHNLLTHVRSAVGCDLPFTMAST